jgi:hypothetical protein
MKASELSPHGYSSFLLKAPPGTGKTIAACSFSILGPTYLAYWDKQQPIELLTFFKKHRPELLDRIEYDVFGPSNANEFLNKLIEFSKDCRYVNIVIDSVTNMTSGGVGWSMSFSQKAKKKSDEILVPGWDEYKTETSLVIQSLDLCRKLPANIIWTAHPVPSVKLEGSGTQMKVTKSNPIVTYGSKVAGILPGNFNEIYHFYKLSDWSSQSGALSTRYIVSTDAVGDDYAKSSLGLAGELDITNKLFYEVWKEALAKLEEPTTEPTKQSEPKFKWRT